MQIVFDSTAPQFLALAILSGAVTAYLLSLRQKTLDLRFLLGTFSCWTIYFLLWVCFEALYPGPRWFEAVQLTSALGSLPLFVAFAYYFLGCRYPREARVALALVTFAVIVTSAILFYELASGKPFFEPLGSGIALLLLLWAEVVFVRRWFSGASVREAQAHRALALVFFLGACAVGVYVLRDVAAFPSDMARLIGSLLYLCTLVGFALVYVNNAPQSTTFQVKIVGLSLFTVLAVLTIVSTAFSPPPASVPLPNGQALRLTPESDSHYVADTIPLHFDPVLGNRLELHGGAEARLALPWPLRFYGREWREIWVRRSGAVRFSTQPLLRNTNYLFTDPFIAPMIPALPPGSGAVYIKQEPQSVTVTWQSPSVSVQLVLHRDGAIDFVYNRTGHQPFLGRRGISPGGNLAVSKEFALPLPLQRQDSALIEDFDFSNRLAAHKGVVKSVYCILGSALFILTIFPLFFRVSLVNPLSALLKGIDQLDEGRRDVEIPVRFNDEIGRLTGNFNRMTRSLKAAEDELKAYAESLEIKVKERTVELAGKNEENERLLLNILPPAIAERLKQGEGTIADAFGQATIIFADIVGFTEFTTRVSPIELVQLLSDLVSEFDSLARQHGVEKIKTIGDAYMAVAGLPQFRSDHAQIAIRMALGMLEATEKRTAHAGKPLQLRIGINSGPVIAGVIGTHKFAYDLWGDAVNIAARMESHGQPGRIQVSEATYRLLQQHYEFEACGEIEVKGKGRMATYLIVPPVKARSLASNG